MLVEKIQPLRIKKKKAGNETHKLSLSLILTIKPSSICKNRPNEETIKIGWQINPTSNPAAPKN